VQLPRINLHFIQFEALKTLLKAIVSSEAEDGSKKGNATLQYIGPLTSCKPASMKNIQAWIVNNEMLEDEVNECQKNHELPFNEKTIPQLTSLFETALELYKRRDQGVTAGRDVGNEA
jgi:hypothetical protein